MAVFRLLRSFRIDRKNILYLHRTYFTLELLLSIAKQICFIMKLHKKTPEGKTLFSLVISLHVISSYNPVLDQIPLARQRFLSVPINLKLINESH